MGGEPRPKLVHAAAQPHQGRSPFCASRTRSILFGENLREVFAFHHHVREIAPLQMKFVVDGGCLASTANMEIFERVDHSVIVLQGEAKLPEGAIVRISYDPASVDSGDGTVEFPLVHSKHLGSVHLSNQQIQEILDAEDLAPRH